MEDPDKITYFGETDFRNKKTRFGIKAKDRARHMYVIGKTGVGKSTLLENMAVQDIQNGEGLAFIDPHGETAEKLLDYIPEHRVKDVIYFAPFDTEYPISFNVMEDVGADKRHLVASGLMTAFKKIWIDAWSARMEYILNNTILALLEYPNATILGVNRMLADKDYRKAVVENVTDPGVKAFWVEEFAKYGERYMQEAGAAIQNKIGQFTANPLIRNIVGQPKSTFDFREAMDTSKIILINLSKGRMGDQNAALLGGMLISKIYVSAMSRADIAPSVLNKLPNFYFYVDEFQNFANESFANILSEARKYKLALTVANQYVAQMEESVRDAVFGNVGTTVSFRVGPLDAPLLEQVFSPMFVEDDLRNLGFAQIYLSLCVNGIGSKPFSANTLLPIEPGPVSFKEQIITYSRTFNARPRADVESAINEWHNQQFAEPKPPRAPREGGASFEGSPSRDNNSKKKSYDRPREESARTYTPRPPQEQKTHKPFEKAIPSVRREEKSVEKTEEKPSLKNLLEKLDTENTPPPPQKTPHKQKPEPSIKKNQETDKEAPQEKKETHHHTGSTHARSTPFKSALRKAPDAPTEGPGRDALKNLLSSIGATPASSAPKVNKEESKPEPEKKIEPKKEEQKSETVNQKNNTGYSPRVPQEIPEDVLRNILKED